MLVTALDSTSDTVDALVGLAVREALEGSLGGLVLLLEEIVVSLRPAVSQNHPNISPFPSFRDPIGGVAGRGNSHT